MKNYIEQNKERFYEELFSLLRIPSISAKAEHKDDMRRCAERLAVLLMEAGADFAEVSPSAGNSFACQRHRPILVDYGC